VANALAMLGRRRPEGASKSLEAEVKCRTSTGWKRARALIDSGAELNLISQLFIKETSWQLHLDSTPPMESIDERRVVAYSSLNVTTNIKDWD